MRQGFKNHLDAIHDINKEHEINFIDAIENGMDEEVIQEINDEAEKAINGRVRKASRTQETGIEAQLAIVDIQKRKGKIMNQLRSAMRDCNDPELIPDQPENTQRVIQKDNDFFVEHTSGKQIKIDLGQLLTDHEWGIKYFLDPETVTSKTRKKFLIENTRTEIQKLLDEQIIINEMHSEKTPDTVKKVYDDILKKRELEEQYLKTEGQTKPEWMSDEEWKEALEGDIRGGIVAEKMIKNFLKKMEINNENVKYKISEADVYQDVRQKVDFIITRKLHTRGIGIEKDEVNANATEAGNIGIQLTTNQTTETIGTKQLQVMKMKEYLHFNPQEVLEDIALVTVNLKELNTLYKQWKKERMPGGPESTMNTYLKMKIIDTVFKDMLPFEEIEEIKKLIDPLHGEQMGVIKKAS